MQLNITKNTGKPHILSYTRDDGSVTWMYSDDFFTRHDLSHYAIETIMEYRTAFYGMLNDGMDIGDFEDREKRLLIPMTDEARWAENMANLFLMETTQGTFPDFNEVQQNTGRSSFGDQYLLMTLSPDQIEGIRNRLRQLLAEWDALPVGETLTLTFTA